MPNGIFTNSQTDTIYSITRPLSVDEHLTKQQNILLSHICPTETDINIANKMLKNFIFKLQEIKKQIKNKEKSINFIIFICNNIDQIFRDIKQKPQDKLTYGVYKHFFNIAIEYLRSSNITIARSFACPTITTIQKEKLLTNELFNPQIFLKQLWK